MLKPTFMSPSGQYFIYNKFQVKYWPEDDLNVGRNMLSQCIKIYQ